MLIHADVAVVGGGPVGLLVAAEVAGRGVDTVLFEAEAAVSERPKATTLHARAVQCLVRRGRLPGVWPLHREGDVTRPFHFAGVRGLVVSAPGTEPEPLVKRPQVEVERAFQAQACAAGVRVLRGHRVDDPRRPGGARPGSG